MSEIKDCWAVCYMNRQGKHVIVKAYTDELAAAEVACMWTMESDVRHYVKRAKASRKESAI